MGQSEIMEKRQNTEFPPLKGGNKKLEKGTKWTKRKKKTPRIIQCFDPKEEKMQVANSIQHSN